MGADRLRVVFRQEIPRAILAGEHVEVVLPEIDHHFVQLTLAHRRARHPARREFAQESVRLTPLLAQRGGIGGRDGAAATLPLRQYSGRRRIVGQQLLAGLTESREAGHELLGTRVRNAFGIQLAVDPGVDAHGAHRVSVARSGAESQAIDDVMHLLVGRLLARGTGPRRGIETHGNATGVNPRLTSSVLTEGQRHR